MTIAIVLGGVTEYQSLLQWAARFALADAEDLLVLDVAQSKSEDEVRTIKPGSVPRNADLAKAIGQLAENGFQWVAQLSDESEQTPDEDPDEVPAEDSQNVRRAQWQEVRQPARTKGQTHHRHRDRRFVGTSTILIK